MTLQPAAARSVARQCAAGALKDLRQWLRIPSISGDPAHRESVNASARWIADRLRRSTHAVRVVTTPTGPIVLARIPGRRVDAPAIVLYGHLDVRAAGPGWTSPPFGPIRRGDRLIARGSSDDKGQTLAHIVAAEAWCATGGPPGDVVVIVDGAEEIGSPGLGAVLSQQKQHDLLGGPVDAVLMSDTRMTAPGVPSLTVSQRGMLGVAVSLSSGLHAVHAGRFGGAVVDPTLRLARLLEDVARAISRLRGATVANRPTDDEVRAALVGRACATDRLAARTTSRGALSVTSFSAGAAPGSIPYIAKADLDIRLPPEFDPAAAYKRVARILSSNAKSGLRIELKCVSSARGMLLTHPPIIRGQIDDACREAFGNAPSAGIGACR